MSLSSPCSSTTARTAASIEAPWELERCERVEIGAGERAGAEHEALPERPAKPRVGEAETDDRDVLADSVAKRVDGGITGLEDGRRPSTGGSGDEHRQRVTRSRSRQRLGVVEQEDGVRALAVGEHLLQSSRPGRSSVTPEERGRVDAPEVDAHALGPHPGGEGLPDPGGAVDEHGEPARDREVGERTEPRRHVGLDDEVRPGELADGQPAHDVGRRRRSWASFLHDPILARASNCYR